MSDDADRADPRIEDTIADGIAEVRRSTSLIAVGFCHYCGEGILSGRLFCDVDCRDDYQHEQARRKANGR